MKLLCFAMMSYVAGEAQKSNLLYGRSALVGKMRQAWFNLVAKVLDASSVHYNETIKEWLSVQTVLDAILMRSSKIFRAWFNLVMG